MCYTLRRAARLAAAAVLASVAVAVAAIGLTGCSPKKNNAATRNYQAFLTRYNIYFNGDQHYKETLKALETAYEDDYTGPLIMHPSEAKGVEGLPQHNGSFKRSIEKAQKAIQLHSIHKRPARKGGKTTPEKKAWLKREEYNPFMHNAWMMMARSQYHDGDFLGAASTFYYISRHFPWLPSTVTEARLWQARSYLAMDWLYEAEVIVTRIKTDQLTSRRVRELYAFTMGDLWVRMHDYDRAIPYVAEAARLSSRSQRHRLYYVLGRVCALAGRKEEAAKAYAAAAKAPGTSHRARLNARIRQSEVYTGTDITPEVKALRRMARYGINRDYQDQIYYAIGNLWLSRGDTLKAISSYEEAARRSTRAGIDKAISQAALGALYYDRGEYAKAQPCYAEAASQLPDTYQGIDLIKRRSDVLDQMAVYAQNVTLNDSLLRLAAMPEADRLKAIDTLIETLKKKERDEAEDARREAYLADQAAKGTNLNQGSASPAPQEFTLNADRSWYFYNTATRNAGRTEFQRRWGSRRLEDDWRRRNKASFAMAETEDPDEADETDPSDISDTSDTSENQDKPDPKGAERSNDPHYREYYLKQIPSTPEQTATCHDVIQEGLYNTGLILKDRMEDYAAARVQWDDLLKRYPDNIYRLDTYHNLYLMYMRQGREDLAEPWRQLILSDFAVSPYAEAMRQPGYIDRLRAMEAEQAALYTQAYAHYLAGRNDQVHQARSYMEKAYPVSPLMPRFMFIDALAYVTDKQHSDFARVIKDLVQRYPDSEPAPLAAAWAQGIDDGRQLQATAANTRGMLWETRLSNDSTLLASGGAGGDIEFSLNPAEPHCLVLLFPADAISPAALLYNVARHNFSTYVVKDFDLEVMNFGPLGVLVVKGFDNKAQLGHYRTLMARDPLMALPPQVRPVEISQGDFEQLLKGAGSFDDYFRRTGQESLRTAQESVLDALPEDETLPGRPDKSDPSGTPIPPAEGSLVPDEDLPAAGPPSRGPVILPDYPIGSEGDDDDD